MAIECRDQNGIQCAYISHRVGYFVWHILSLQRKDACWICVSGQSVSLKCLFDGMKSNFMISCVTTNMPPIDQCCSVFFNPSSFASHENGIKMHRKMSVYVWKAIRNGIVVFDMRMTAAMATLAIKSPHLIVTRFVYEQLFTLYWRQQT